jgi:hypothetical protein
MDSCLIKMLILLTLDEVLSRTYCSKEKLLICITSMSNLRNNIQGYSRETSDENFVLCNPKYKNLIFCLIRNKLAIQVAWRIRLTMTFSRYWGYEQKLILHSLFFNQRTTTCWFRFVQLIAKKNGNCQNKIDTFLQFFHSVNPSYRR